MILVTRALYQSDADRVQVAVVIQTDDGDSAADQVASGSMALLHGDTEIANVVFDATHKYVRYQDDEIDDVGEFYGFFLHPPIQRNMTVKTTVTLYDDNTASTTTPVEVLTDRTALDAQNPALAGRDVSVFPKTPDKP